MARPSNEGVRGGGWVAWVFGLAFAVLVLAPFLYMVVTALFGEPGAFRYRGAEGFITAVTVLPFRRYVATSVILAVAATAGQVFTSATAAYALARFRFAGRERVLLVYLSALTVPAVLLVIPRFLLIDALGWVDRYRGLISTELVSVSGILLMRQFFRAIPRDLEDAARLEGAGEWVIFWRVILPSSRHGLAAIAALAFADQWRSFLWPLVATSAETMRPLEVGIADLRGLYALSWPDQMAVVTLAMLPVLIVFLVAHRYFISGVQETGLMVSRRGQV